MGACLRGYYMNTSIVISCLQENCIVFPGRPDVATDCDGEDGAGHGPGLRLSDLLRPAHRGQDTVNYHSSAQGPLVVEMLE